MTMNLTVKDVGSHRPFKPKNIGAKLDYRMRPELRESSIESLIDDLKGVINQNDLVLSGFGYVNYSGILISTSSKPIFKRKLKILKSWSENHKDKFKLFRLSKIQGLDDIFYE